MKKNLILIKALYDPRISRIEKILAKFCPKFLDLYASIYGSMFLPPGKQSVDAHDC
jgi:hypothetical protein